MVEGLGCFLVRLEGFQEPPRVREDRWVSLPRWVSNTSYLSESLDPESLVLSCIAPRLAFKEALPVSQLPQHRLRLREGAWVGCGPEPPPFHLRDEAVKPGLVGCLCRWHARS